MNTDLARAIAITVTYIDHRDAVLDKLHTYALTGVRAQSLEQDRNTGHSTTPPDDEEPAGPRVSDPTATAARPDPLRQLLDDIARHERRLVDQLNTLIGHPIVATPDQLGLPLRHYRGSHHPTNTTITAAARTLQTALAHTIDAHTTDQTGRSADGDPGCESCARLKTNGTPWWNTPSYNSGDPTDLGGALPAKRSICRTCYRFAIEQEPTRLPTVDELRHRHDDPRGQWPKRYAKTG
jgi:hypothetical protein